MKQPWLKFYVGDWRSDPALRMCSLAARGLWMDMLCVMHEAEPYGSLVINEMAVNGKQLASLCGAPVREVLSMLMELKTAGVFSQDGDVIYSRRMRRDHEKAQKDKANGNLGGNPHLNGWVNPPHKAQKLEARSQKERTDSRAVADAPRPAERFDEFWKSYPRRDGANPKAPAQKRFDSLVKSGTNADEIIAGAKSYATFMRSKGQERTQFVAQAITWLNQSRWRDDGNEIASHEADLTSRGMVRIMPETPQWEAWKASRDGKSLPIDRDGGWWCPTEYPLQREPAR